MGRYEKKLLVEKYMYWNPLPGIKEIDLSNNNYPHTYYDSISPFIKSIIDTEGPILEGNIIKRIGDANGIKRCGNVIQENLRWVLDKMLSQYDIIKLGDYYSIPYPKSMPIRERDPLSQPFDSISPFEIREMLSALLTFQEEYSMDELIKACICGFGYARTSPAMKDRTMDVIIYMKDEEELDIKKGFSDEDTIVCASPITGIDELGEENITISIIISFIRSSSFKEWDRKIKEIPSNYLSSEEERALHVITTAKKRVQKCKKAHLMKQVTAILERAYFSGHVTFMDIPDFKKPMKHDSKPDNWAITSAIKISKKLDDNFFLYNSMNVPKYLSLFFDGGQLTKGENRNISLFYDKKIYPCRIIKIKQYCNLRLYFDLKLVNEIENISKRGKGDVTLVFEKDTKTVDSYKITVR